MATHYAAIRRFGLGALCGTPVFEPGTTDPKQVDCKTCLERLSKLAPGHLAALTPKLPAGAVICGVGVNCPTCSGTKAVAGKTCTACAGVGVVGARPTSDLAALAPGLSRKTLPGRGAA